MWWYMSKYYNWDYRQKYYSEIRGTNQNEILLKASECIRIYPCCETWNLKVTFHWKLLFLIPDHWWQVLLSQISAPCAVSPVNSPNAPSSQRSPGSIHTPDVLALCPSLSPITGVPVSSPVFWMVLAPLLKPHLQPCLWPHILLLLPGWPETPSCPFWDCSGNSLSAQESLHCRALVPLALGSPSLLLLCPGRSTGVPSKHYHNTPPVLLFLSKNLLGGLVCFPGCCILSLNSQLF